MSSLVEWYNQQTIGTRVAVLIKDFEMCPKNVLENFILLLRFIHLNILSLVIILVTIFL